VHGQAESEHTSTNTLPNQHDSTSSDEQPWDKIFEGNQDGLDASSHAPSKHEDADTIAVETHTDMGNHASNTEASQGLHYNLRPGHEHSYNHWLAINMNQSHGTKSYNPHVQLLQLALNNLETCPGNMFSYIFGFMMMQMTASQGIRKHGQKAVDALFSEFYQLDDKTVFDPINATLLSKAQKRLHCRPST